MSTFITFHETDDGVGHVSFQLTILSGRGAPLHRVLKTRLKEILDSALVLGAEICDPNDATGTELPS